MSMRGFLLLLALTATLACPVFAQAVEKVVVTVKSNGVVVAELQGSLAEGVNELPLLVEPIPESIEVYVGGELIPAIYFNGSLFIPLEAPASFSARYVVNTTAANGKFTFLVKDGVPVLLIVEPGIVLTSLPKDILDTEVEDGRLLLTFTGPATLSYTIAKAKPTEGAPPPPPPLPMDLAYVALSVVIIMAVVLAIKLRRRPRPSRSPHYTLDDTDEAILRKLSELGGSAPQSILQRELNIPKTTLWRRIRRLAEMGYVDVSKDDKVHRVSLRAKL